MIECVVRMDEMPKVCMGCNLEYDAMPCIATGTSHYRPWSKAFDSEKERHHDCPVICSLPEGHGRLGDLDKIQKAINKARIEAMQKGLDTNPYWLVLDIIAQTTAVVPAQKNKGDI